MKGKMMMSKKSMGMGGKVTAGSTRWKNKNLAINTKKYIGETRKKKGK